MPDTTTPLVFVDLLQVADKATKSGRPQRWRWVAKNGANQKILARSSERYINRQDCHDAITQLFGAGTNIYLRQDGHGDQPLRRAQDGP
jgi:uncharacterized protein YegP (UPF0339 family)